MYRGNPAGSPRVFCPSGPFLWLGGSVERLTISCLNCKQGWFMTTPFSVYEQQAQESCPCPLCGSYTLCCAAPEKPLRRRETAAAR